MDCSKKLSFVCRMFIMILIYIPGSAFNTIESLNVTATTSSSIKDTNATRDPLLLRSSINDNTFLRTKSTTEETSSTASSSTTSLPTSLNSRIFYAITLMPPTTNDAFERKATNVNISMGTKDSLNPSMTSIQRMGLRTTSMEITEATTQVTIATLLSESESGTDFGPRKSLNNGAYGSNIDNNRNNKNKTTNTTLNNNGHRSESSQTISSSTEKPEENLQESNSTEFSEHFRSLNGAFAGIVLSIPFEQQALLTTSTTILVQSATNRIIKDNKVDVNNVDEFQLNKSHDETVMNTSPNESLIEKSTIVQPTATTSPRQQVKTTLAVTTLLPLAVDGYQTITSQAGTHAYLPCNVKQLVKKPISWLRVRDGHILTVDQTTFIADQRFQSIYTANPERWSLQIKYVQTKDAGTYECQVSTEPKTSAIVTLNIVEPKTELIGESTRHVKAGSQVKLHCIISQALEPPLFINWFYNQKQIYLHNRRGWRTEIERKDIPPEMSALTTKATTLSSKKVGTALSSTLSATGKRRATAILFASTVTAADVKQITTASLIIPSVEKLDSGNYTCSPSNSAPMTVVLHVLNGEYSASAITSGIRSHCIFLREYGGGRYFQWNLALTTMTMICVMSYLKTI